MRLLGIIPARYNSTRLPGKPLRDILGKPMIQHVYEKAINTLDHVIIATDDERIFDVAKGFGAEVVMTGAHHTNGTSRCYEAFQVYEKQTDEKIDIVINIQGDEPMIDPSQIEDLKFCILNSQNFQIGTLAKKITHKDELFNSSECYVVFNKKQEALYFSRSTIPFIANVPSENWIEHKIFHKHIGLYAYHKKSLKKIISMPPSSLELSESLEQNRWVEHGEKINIGLTVTESLCVDTEEDLNKVISLMKNK